MEGSHAGSPRVVRCGGAEGAQHFQLRLRVQPPRLHSRAVPRDVDHNRRRQIFFRHAKNRWCFDVLPEHHHWHQHEAAQNEVVWLWIQLQECQQSEQEQDFFILRKHTSTSKSKQTQKQIKYTPRSENKSCVANATGSTGETFQHSFSLVDYFRPHLSVLENVPNLAQEGQLENGTLLSDLGYITTKFEDAGMTCLSTILDRRRLILFV